MSEQVSSNSQFPIEFQQKLDRGNIIALNNLFDMRYVSTQIRNGKVSLIGAFKITVLQSHISVRYFNILRCSQGMVEKTVTNEELEKLSEEFLRNISEIQELKDKILALVK